MKKTRKLILVRETLQALTRLEAVRGGDSHGSILEDPCMTAQSPLCWGDVAATYV